MLKGSFHSDVFNWIIASLECFGGNGLGSLQFFKHCWYSLCISKNGFLEGQEVDPQIYVHIFNDLHSLSVYNSASHDVIEVINIVYPL